MLKPEINSDMTDSTVSGRLEGWKEIASHLRRTVRTVQRWEKEERLPIHRHAHQKLGSIIAYKSELDAWQLDRQNSQDKPAVEIDLAPQPLQSIVRPSWQRPAPLFLCGLLLVTITCGFLILRTRSATPNTIHKQTQNVSAKEAYLKGRYAWHKDTRRWFEESAKYFETAVKLDPEFADGWAGLASTYATMGLFGMRPPKDCLPLAQAAAQKALALDPTSAEAHAALGQVKFYWLWDREGAEQEFHAALRLNQSLASVHQSYAHFLSAMGRHEEAIAQAKRAQELEPLSATINSTAGWFYYIARRYDEALFHWHKALELEPQFTQVQSSIAAAYHKQGRLEHARLAELKYLDMIGLGAIAKALNVSDPQKALLNFNRLRLSLFQGLAPDFYVSPGNFVKMYAEMNEREELFDWLETALTERDVLISLINVHPLFDQYRTDPRFVALTTRLTHVASAALM